MRGGVELLADGFFGAAAVADIAIDASAQANLVRRFDVDRIGVERLQLGEVHREVAFADEDRVGNNAVEGSGVARGSFELVDGAAYLFAVGEGSDVLDYELGFE